MKRLIRSLGVLVTLFGSEVISSPVTNIKTDQKSALKSLPQTALPTTTNATSNTCNQYVVMNPGTNWCADGFEGITSSAECESYFNSPLSLGWKKIISSSISPKGCYVKFGSGIWFNSHPEGSTRDERAPICKSLMSPWSASPSLSPSTALPSVKPSISLVPTTNVPSLVPTTNVPSLVPTTHLPSLVPLWLPSSTPSATRIDWWASNPNYILEGHTDNLHSLSFSPNGSWLASASADTTVKLWSAKNGGGAIQTLNKHSQAVYFVHFSPDSTMLVSSGLDRYTRIILWQINSDGIASFSKVLDGHSDSVFVVKFSPDGQFIASAGFDGEIIIWSLNDGCQLLHKLEGHKESVRDLSFSIDSKVLASASHDHSIKLWDTENGGVEIASYTEHTNFVRSVEFSGDGTLLASGSDDNSVKIWSFRDSKLSLVRTLVVGYSTHSVKFSPDGKYLASASSDDFIKLWDRNDDYYNIQTFRGHIGSIFAIDFTADGQKIASGSADKTIKIWGRACQPGTYGTHPDCQPCKPGTYKSDVDMPTCDPCAAGTAQKKSGATECDVCAAGTFQPFKGKQKCEECRVGGYCSNKVASDSCDGGFIACPVGTYNNVTGAYNETACVKCPQGTFHGNRTGLEFCSQCPKGTYSKAGSPLCSECGVGTVQNQAGQSTCEVCPSDTFPDQSKVSCLPCSYRLGSYEESTKCSFCADGFYLKVLNVKSDSLIKNPDNFCLPCPDNARCEKNTTIETLQSSPGYWRASLQTETFYKCNDISGVCFGGTLCAEDHSGVRCEVCVGEKKYFDSSKGECTSCPSFLKLSLTIGIVLSIIIFLFVMKYIAEKHGEYERHVMILSSTLTAIGIQAKLKILISFFQVVVTIQTIYGVRMQSAFVSSWDFILDPSKTFGIPFNCFRSMKMRLLIVAVWPVALALLLISGMFIYAIVINSQRLERKDAFARFLSLSLRGIIVIFYLVLPSISQRIFDARTCEVFASNDSKNEFSSYLISDLSVQCHNGDPNYEDLTKVFWALFAIWPVAVPVGVFVLILKIRPSVQSNTPTPLAEACQFLWFDYNRDMMFWEVIELVRKISLTCIILFIDPLQGAERILRLVIGTMIFIFYCVILSYARPYKCKDDFNLAIVSNLLLTCFFLLGIIIHQCIEGDEMDEENNMCMKLFGISEPFYATALAIFLISPWLLHLYYLYLLSHRMK